MKFNKSVSVIMPCHNSEKYVQEAIHSIQKQTFTDFELIIINDGSTDSTESIVSQISDPRIRYFKTPQQRGNFPSRNFGFSFAQGKYICVMDSDDIAISDRLQIQYDYMEMYANIGLIGSWAVSIDENGKTICTVPKILDNESLKIALLRDSVCIHPTLFFRSDIIRKYNLFYDENMKFAADYDFLVRFSAKFPINNLQNVLLKYRCHPQQISVDKRSEQMEYAKMVRLKQIPLFEVDLSQREQLLYLNLMAGIPIHPIQKPEYLDLINLLLRSNHNCKYYDHDKLLNFLLFTVRHALLAYTLKEIEEKMGDRRSQL